MPHGDLADPERLALRLRVNGETRQSANTKDMTWSVPEILFWLSQGSTLEPGDIVLTGTPEGVGIAMSPPSFLKPGEVVEAEVEGIGTLVSDIVPA
ncbi:MAG: fumarylacetoacetate hydrolase family protein [Chloroflexi bacterium]|nr:fumarylacetoacetate hydrolase family protein [Chloroflexota bacterium]